MGLIHHSKTKGDIGLTQVISDLTKREVLVFLPLSEHSPIDLIAYSNSFCKTIQVKFLSINKKGFLKIDCRSGWSNSKGHHKLQMDKDNIDIVAVYCPETDKCYYISTNEFETSTINLRIKEPKQNQLSIKWANKYLSFPPIYKDDL